MCKVCGSWAPAHGQDTVGPSTVKETVRAARGRGSIRTDDGGAPGLLQRQSISSTLQLRAMLVTAIS